ncbi:DUF3299 domain-containing protein [Engelhardtia mirabilis]|uniref:DUF3299 domain-containing protein n=1 Tax=Engelhardtia mirabilis TaxID=2528011 RepID=A0A518BG43_9BACT|nr:hypothetical protein Pla133_10130 [Planctomycetes bacterium Pla133]QDV00273.1 hypothetical protein Pla86_10120 [Planctomycetes bacterium Pla86]
MRLIPIVLLTSVGIAGLVFGAGLLTQHDEDQSFERDDLPPMLVGTRLDAVEVPVATSQRPDSTIEGTSAKGSNALASSDTAGEASPAEGGGAAAADLFAPDTNQAAGGGDDIIPLAGLPGREHTMGAYSSGSGASDLPLEEGVELVAFDDLMLPDYVPPAVLDGDDDEQRDAADLFPEEIASLDGERVALEGFMMPLEFSGNRVTAFVLSPYPPGCCFGGMPMLDEWVDVSLTDDEGVEYFAYRVVRVTGDFSVGEELDDWGYVTSLYRMQSDKVEKLW